LASDWHESPMLISEPGGVKLAWVAILCMAKSRGRTGRFELRPEMIARDFGCTVDDVRRVVEIAQQHGSIVLEDANTVWLVNWACYQDPSKRKTSGVKEPENGFSKSQGFSKSPTFSKSATTTHHSPLTKHQAPITNHQSPSTTHEEEEEPRDARKRTEAVRSKPVAASKRIKLVDGSWTGITEQDRELWREAFPAVNIDTQLAAMLVWLDANPRKAAKSNYARFIASWMTRSQDRGGGIASNRTPQQVRDLGAEFREQMGFDISPKPDNGTFFEGK
jgi:hypothetical protein